jgi:hypothetical protein
MNEEPRIDSDEQENVSPEDQGQTERAETAEGFSDQGDIIINS